MKINQKTNINPQRQQHINIMSYLTGPKIFKKQNHANLPFKSLLKKDQVSPISIRHNFQHDNEDNNQTNPFSARNTFRSQRYTKGQQQNINGFYTSRNNEKQAQMRVSFQRQKLSSSKVHTMNKEVNSATRNRFYYKEEYDSQTNTENQQYSSASQLQKKQSQRILPGYFNKLNSLFQRNNMQDNSSTNTRQTRSKSPLGQSHQQLFAKCYKETNHHLNLMLKEIHQSQQNLYFVKKDIMDTVYQRLKQRAIVIREKVIETVQQILDEWESNEWNFLKNNEILFLDDLLQMEERLNQKQNKINYFIQRLQNEKRQNWEQLKNNIQTMKKDTVWKNVTTDLLMFNYEDSIIEIQQMTQKISLSITQKCNKAIDLLTSPSTMSKKFCKQMNKSFLSEVNNPEVINQLKTSIVNFVEEKISFDKKQNLNKVAQYPYHYQNNKDPYFTSSLYQLQ